MVSEQSQKNKEQDGDGIVMINIIVFVIGFFLGFFGCAIFAVNGGDDDK